MKTHVVLALSLILASMSAVASEAVEPLLTWTRISGDNPRTRRTFECKISENEVLRASYTRDERPRPTRTQVAYTDEVRSAAQIRSLLAKAKRGKLLERPAPIGFGTFKMEGKGGVVLKKRAGKLTENQSAAAETLIQFIVYNCNEQ
jgi:hypothetical protein